MLCSGKMRKKLIALLAGTSIFVGIPLVAWGLGGSAEFFQNPARLTYVLLTLVAQILGVLLVPNSGVSNAEGATVVARQRVAVFLLQVLTVAIVAIGPWSDRWQWGAIHGEGIRYVGIAFYALGLFLMNWAVISLGRHFSIQVTIQKDHQLVTDGPYRLVRHPRYAGILICFFGIALVFASAVALVVAGLLLGTILWRIADEEALMARSFPADWPVYAQSTARLIPGIY